MFFLCLNDIKPEKTDNGHLLTLGGVDMAKKLVAILFLILITLPTMFSCASCFGVPYAEVEVSGNEVENSVNNYLAGGNLARIGDKLFFNYAKNSGSYGLIEISSSGSKVIRGNEPKLKSYGLRCALFEHNNLLLSRIPKSLNDDGAVGVHYYSEQEEKFKQYDGFSFLGDNGLGDRGDLYPQFAENGAMIYGCGKEQTGNVINLTVYHLAFLDSATEKFIVNAEVSEFFVSGNKVYYLTYVKDDESGKIIDLLRVYDLDSQTDILLYEFEKDNNVSHLFVCDNHLVCRVYDPGIIGERVLISDLNSDRINFKEVISDENITSTASYSPYSFRYDGIAGMNCYGHNVYIATAGGVYAYNVASGKLSKLCNVYAEECYIVDDYWVYFVGEESSLWRVAQDGSNVERIYG